MSQQSATFKELWKQFLPLSLSDITMALGDPLVSTTLAHLPEARTSLAAIGVARSQAIFFESPIIMLLHASNALAPNPAARRALFYFTLLMTLGLTLAMGLLCFEPVFRVVGINVLGVDPSLVGPARAALMLFILWPGAIGWRRFYQGLLIHNGHGKAIGLASLSRAILLAALLAAGFALGLPGVTLAGGAMVLGVLCELAFVVLAAHRHNLLDLSTQGQPSMTLREIVQFYWPLANSMVVVWGGRALLVGLVAHSVDGSIALAAWPAAWGLVLLIANSTRMVQQVTIRHHHHTPAHRLLGFAFSVGGACSLILLLLSSSSWGQLGVEAFLGHDAELVKSALPVLRICSAIPLMVALQNSAQGFLIGEGRTQRVNAATWLGTITLLSLTAFLIRRGTPGASAAALAMTASMALELTWLQLGRRQRTMTPQVST